MIKLSREEEPPTVLLSRIRQLIYQINHAATYGTRPTNPMSNSESQEIMAVWATMPDNTCFMDALRKMEKTINK